MSNGRFLEIVSSTSRFLDDEYVQNESIKYKGLDKYFGEYESMTACLLW